MYNNPILMELKAERHIQEQYRVAERGREGRRSLRRAPGAPGRRRLGIGGPILLVVRRRLAQAWVNRAQAAEIDRSRATDCMEADCA